MVLLLYSLLMYLAGVFTVLHFTCPKGVLAEIKATLSHLVRNKLGLQLSWSEQGTHNALVQGSNPCGPRPNSHLQQLHMAYITLKEYFERRRKEVSELASDDHWMALTEPDGNFYNPSPTPWYLVSESNRVVRVTEQPLTRRAWAFAITHRDREHRYENSYILETWFWVSIGACQNFLAKFC